MSYRQPLEEILLVMMKHEDIHLKLILRRTGQDRFQALTAASMKMTTIKDLAPFILV
jgi:hypothetical protein